MGVAAGENGTQAPRSPGVQEKILARLIGLALLLVVTVAVTEPWRHGADWRVFVQDDVFYYLKVAMNVAAGNGSTFNGVVPTNGYQPLWLWVFVAIEKLGHQPHNLMPFFAGSIWLATLAVYLLALLFFRRAGFATLLSSLSAAYVAGYAWSLFCLGMETTLAMPLAALLLVAVQSLAWWLRPGWTGFYRSAAVGLLMSAVCLARVDAALLIALLAVCFLAVPALRERLQVATVAGLGIGGLPFAVYLASNRLLFGGWLPISGASKQLKLDHGFSSPAWVSAFLGTHRTQALSPLVTLAAIAVLPWAYRRLQPAERVFVPAALLFPFVQVAVLSWVSDWQLWTWYFYSFRLSMMCALLVLFRPVTVQRSLERTPVLAGLSLLIVARLVTLRWYPQFPDIVGVADHLKSFAATHPGRYAMGDRSGAVGYELPDPIIQTEGLMMDRNFLTHTARQEPLRSVLASYGVRYYVATSFGPFHGCWQAVEPAQGGAHVPKMRAEFCEPPVDWFIQRTGMETMIYDLQPRAPRP